MVLVQSVEGNNVKREERAQLGAIVDEVTSWVRQARTAGFLAEHMPLSGRVSLSSDDATLLGDVALADGSHDLETADSLRRSRLFTGRKKLQPAHEAAARVGAFHHYMTTTQRGAALGQLCQRLIDQHERERADVAATLEALFALRFDANEALELSEHLPLTRSGVLTADERTSMESLVRLYDLHATPTAELLEGQACGTGQCSELHTSAALLHAVHTEARSSGNARQITEASKRLTKQAKAEASRAPEARREGTRVGGSSQDRPEQTPGRPCRHRGARPRASHLEAHPAPGQREPATGGAHDGRRWPHAPPGALAGQPAHRPGRPGAHQGNAGHCEPARIDSRRECLGMRTGP